MNFLAFIYEVEDLMIPCLNKKLFGFDCLGCGFQRAFIFLLKGEFIAAFKMYPAIYTLIILAIYILLNLYFRFKNASKVIRYLAILNLLIIVTNYIIKMNQ